MGIRAGIPAQNCLLGPELPDISSTAANKACMEGDFGAACRLLHPEVASRLMMMYGHPAEEPKVPSRAKRALSVEGTHTTSSRSYGSHMRVASAGRAHRSTGMANHTAPQPT